MRPPADAVRSPGAATVDGTGGGQALATVDRLGRLLDNIGQSPPPALKSGGLGIRELRRLAKAMGTDEAITAMDVEVLAAAGLIAAADSRGRMAESWTPTAEADDFLDGPDEAGWAQVAAIWLDLRRNPSRVGSRDASDKVQNALSPELSWIRGPAERRFVLSALAELPAGSGLDIDGVDRATGLALATATGRTAGRGAAGHDRRGHCPGRCRFRLVDHRGPGAARPGRSRTPRPHWKRPCRTRWTR